MAVTIVEGTTGSVTFATGYEQCPTSWTVNLASEDVATECLGDEWKTRIAGLNEWGGTFTCRLTTMLCTWSAGSVTNKGLALGQASATATFTFATSSTISGSIIITGADISIALGGTTAEIVFTFVGDGAPTFT